MSLADDLDELVAQGYAMRFDHPDGEHVVLTELAAEKMRRSPDITGGFRDPEVSRRPCLGRSNPAGNLDYLDTLVANGRLGGIFGRARRMTLEHDASTDLPPRSRGAGSGSKAPKGRKAKAR